MVDAMLTQEMIRYEAIVAIRAEENSLEFVIFLNIVRFFLYTKFI